MLIPVSYLYTCIHTYMYIRIHGLVLLYIDRVTGAGRDSWPVRYTVHGRQVNGASERSSEGDKETSGTEPRHTTSSTH